MPSNFHPSDNGNPYKDYDNNDLFSFYKNFKPIRKPGEKYEYSNLAVGTLGVILERVNQEDYEALFLKTICKPLHMSETKEFLLQDDSAKFAKGYNEEGVYNSQWDFKALAAAGAIRSTTSDLMKYAKANLGDAPPKLYKAIQLTHEITFTEGTTKISLAWHYIKPGNDEVIFHNGGTGGYHKFIGSYFLLLTNGVFMKSSTSIQAFWFVFLFSETGSKVLPGLIKLYLFIIEKVTDLNLLNIFKNILTPGIK